MVPARWTFFFAVLCLVGLSACATTDGRSGTRPAVTSNSAESVEAPGYPTWTKVTGLLLTPFTGATGSVAF